MAASALTPKRLALPAPADEVPAEYRRPGQRRRVVMLRVMPAEPPCFEPGAWREYVLDAAEQDSAHSGPLTWHHGEPLFNRGWNFCADCMPHHAVSMDRQGRCQPTFHRRPRAVSEGDE